jgi:hypothetical protein
MPAAAILNSLASSLEERLDPENEFEYTAEQNLASYLKCYHYNTNGVLEGAL